jgi:hypothetical protein
MPITPLQAYEYELLSKELKTKGEVPDHVSGITHLSSLLLFEDP